MKKQMKKLNLTRETLHVLSNKDWGRGIAAGTGDTEFDTDTGYTCHSCASTPYQTCPIYLD